MKKKHQQKNDDLARAQITLSSMGRVPYRSRIFPPPPPSPPKPNASDDPAGVAQQALFSALWLLAKRYRGRSTAALSAFFGLIASAYVAGGYISPTVEEHRFWAGRITETVVAGWQSDRFAADQRDMEARVLRLETKQKVSPRDFNISDAKELDYWRNQLRLIKDRIREIETSKRPVQIK